MELANNNGSPTSDINEKTDPTEKVEEAPADSIEDESTTEEKETSSDVSIALLNEEIRELEKERDEARSEAKIARKEVENLKKKKPNVEGLLDAILRCLIANHIIKISDTEPKTILDIPTLIKNDLKRIIEALL